MNKISKIVIFISLTLPYSVAFVPLIILNQKLNLSRYLAYDVDIIYEYQIFTYFLILFFFFSYVYFLRTFKRKYKFNKIYYLFYCFFVLNYLSLPLYIENDYLIFLVNILSSIIIIYFNLDLFKTSVTISFIYLLFFWFSFENFYSIIFTLLVFRSLQQIRL
jgi:hypothetical protein